MNNDSLANALNQIVDDTASTTSAPDTVARRPADAQAFLDAVRGGYKPIIGNVPVSLYQGEVGHFFFQNVRISQRQIVGQSIVGQSAGITIYDDSMAFSFGQSEGRIRDDWQRVKFGVGTVVLTNMRFVFIAQTSFTLTWQEILDINFDWKCVALTCNGRTPLICEYDDPEMLAWCIQGARFR